MELKCRKKFHSNTNVEIQRLQIRKLANKDDDDISASQTFENRNLPCSDRRKILVFMLKKKGSHVTFSVSCLYIQSSKIL